MAVGREERGVAWQQGGGEGRGMAVGRRGLWHGSREGGEGCGMAVGREERGVAWQQRGRRGVWHGSREGGKGVACQQGGGEGRDMAVGRRGGGMCDKEGSLEQLTWAYYTHSFEFHKVRVWGKYRP